MYKHLFGPVPSRRLGMSLGVDLIPHKICSLNCIYCECGKTNSLTLQRKEYVPAGEVIEEMRDYFAANPDPDYISFSGNGEPTLHSRIGEVIESAKELRPGVSVAVLTNGTLLTDPQVRRDLMRADLVLPSLDAVTPEAFRRINRPPGELDVATHVQGLVEFRKEFPGEFWLEIFILPGYNDDEENLQALGRAIKEIGPHKVQLNTLDRPGVIDGLRPAGNAELEKISEAWDLSSAELVLPLASRKRSTAYRKDVENTILETISRRPCTLEDLCGILDLHQNEINKYLVPLEESGKIETTELERGTFFQLPGRNSD